MEIGLMVKAKLSRGIAAMIVSWGKRNGLVVVDGLNCGLNLQAVNFLK